MDIVKIIPNIYEEILKPEQIETMKVDVENIIIKSIQTEIASKYNINIS
jgi:hypothetical protein